MILRTEAVRKLRRMAPKMSQAAAARKLGLHRQWVHKLAQDYGIRFHRQRVIPKPRLCSECGFRLGFAGRRECLRCKWTPRRVKRLRERYGLSQIDMAFKVLKMNLWACSRWENERVRPSHRALLLLERAERGLRRK